MSKIILQNYYFNQYLPNLIIIYDLLKSKNSVYYNFIIMGNNNIRRYIHTPNEITILNYLNKNQSYNIFLRKMNYVIHILIIHRL